MQFYSTNGPVHRSTLSVFLTSCLSNFSILSAVSSEKSYFDVLAMAGAALERITAHANWIRTSMWEGNGIFREELRRRRKRSKLRAQTKRIFWLEDRIVLTE